MPAVLYGYEEPRLWTRPLRELTEETSLGFEVIEFARDILGVELYPWQKWLLIHALELMEDGTYRFKRVIVLVARQQGKTLLASVLAAWWLYVDSARHPDRIPPVKFKIVGVAQNLDIARQPWSTVKLWSDPKPETAEDAELALESLQDATYKVSDTNGDQQIIARTRAHYEIRAGKNARGKPAARVLMDEMREQKDWGVWNAVSQTTKAFWSRQLWGFSNAGDSLSVVLRRQRFAALADLRSAGYEFPDYVAAGIDAAEAHANGEVQDTSLGLFEWSALPGCPKDDIEGILQANPSIGWGVMTVADAIADIRGMTDADYRTEVLCQWVTARVNSFIDKRDFVARHVSPELLTAPTSPLRILRDARVVWAVDTAHDRSFTWVAAAVLTANGRPFVQVRVKRAGMLWLPDYLTGLARESGWREVAVPLRGGHAMEFVDELSKPIRGLKVHTLDMAEQASASGRFLDRVLDRQLVVVEQPDIDTAVEGGVAVGTEVKTLSREKSEPVDIAGLLAETFALYALEVMSAGPSIPLPPPHAEVLRRTDENEANLATVKF